MKTLCALVALLVPGLALADESEAVAVRDDLTHSAFDTLLREYVTDDGVRYRAWSENRADVEALSSYVRFLEGIDPAQESRDFALAYWINAYNAVTLDLVLAHYPVDSIKKIGGRFQSPWKKELFRRGDDLLTLDEIENDVIRPEFAEPRIHFALNCAAVSCPPLRAEAYTSERLDEQLEEQTEVFLSDRENNRVDAKGALRLSKIFDWYVADFAEEGGVVEWVRAYLPDLPEGDVSVKHGDYDWALNEAK